MAHTVLLSALYSRIRTRANVRDIKFTDIILDGLIKSAILDTLDVILDENPTYGLKPYADLNVTSGTATVALPSDFYKGFGLQVLDTDGERKWLERFEWLDMEDHGTTYITTRTALRYTEDGTNLRFQTAPGWTLASGLRLWYVCVPSVATADYGVSPTSWDAIFGWDDHVVWNVVAQVLEAKKMDPSFAATMMQRAEARLRRVAKRRDLQKPPRQRDGRAGRSRYKLPPA